MLFKSQITDLYHKTAMWRRHKEKEDLRAILEEKRRILEKEQRDEYSEAIISRLVELPEFKAANVVLAYYPIKNEVNLRPLLEECRDKKVVLLPAVTRHGRRLELRQYAGREDLRRGRFGIPEPQTPKYKGGVDLVIVPGVGFDEDLHRLGRGGGYYDRFLKCRPNTPKVAVAYDFQIVRDVPVDRHDRKVDVVVTPSRVIR